MNRRRFLKRAGLWVPGAIAFPAIVRAQLGDPAFVAALTQSPASPACATSDTSIPHNELLEGFQTATTGYENTWAETGTTANITAAADSSSLTTGKPTGACNQAWKLVVPTTSTPTYATWTRGSPIALATFAVDIVFYFYYTALPATGKRIRPLTIWGSFNDPAGYVDLLNNSGTDAIRFVSAISSSFFSGVFATNSWHKVTIHFDTTDSSCTFAVDAQTPNSFTRYTTAWKNEVLQLAMGVTNLTAGDADNDNLYYDLVCLNKT